jgi:hypothetical protein
MCAPACAIDDPATSETEQGLFSVSNLRTRYSVTANGPSTRTIVIVHPKGYSTLESDLATFRSNAGFPACTSASGCLTIVGEGGGAPPANDDATALPAAGLIQMASAFCRDCKLYVVQLAGTAGLNLKNGLTTAAPQGDLVLIGHSVAETDAKVTDMETIFTNNSGVRWLAASGDGSGAYPASSQKVLAVTGTQDSAGVDVVWSASRTACSGVFSAPAWQSSGVCAGGMRPAADLAGLAKDVTVIFKGSSQGLSNKFLPVGIRGGILALETTLPTPSQIYAASATFRVDVTSQTDATSHTAVSGYDLASGIGIPNGNDTY